MQPLSSSVGLCWAFYQLLTINKALGTCGNPPSWMAWPAADSYLVYGSGSKVPCVAKNAQGFLVPGQVIGKTLPVPVCAAASPLHDPFNSTTFQVLKFPLKSDGDRVVEIPVHYPVVGFRSIKEPECIVTADGGNGSLVDPMSGPLYIGFPNYTATSFHIGAYVPGSGIRTAWMASSWNQGMYLVSFKKDPTASKIYQNNFACYEGIGPRDGIVLRSFVVFGSRTNCVTACLSTPGCSMVTAMPHPQPAVPSPDDGQGVLSSGNGKLLLRRRAPLNCTLYGGGDFVGNISSANQIVCTKLVD